MIIITESNIEKAKNLIKKAIANKEKPIIVIARDDNYNRKLLEYSKFDILLSPEAGQERKDSLRQLDSGLNHVLAKIASKNKIAIGIDIKDIESIANKKEKALRLGRIIQNIKICRKAKCKIKALNYKDKKDAFSFLTSLGASTQQAKEAIS